MFSLKILIRQKGHSSPWTCVHI